MQPPDYTFDPSRLAALDGYAILDTPAEPGFDDIVQLAAQICETPVALVSLVAADRQWFKARFGFEGCQTDLSRSVCAHALVVPDLLVVDDLTQDPRTRDNPLVSAAPHIRFYAGAPFRAATGEVLGSLCVIDIVPRPGGLTVLQASALRNLARQVTSQLDLRRALAERDAFVLEQGRAQARRNALLQLGDSLREAPSVAGMTRVAARIVGQTLGVSRAGFGYLEQDGAVLAVEPDWTAEGVASIAGRHRLQEYGDLQDGLLRGEALIVPDVRTDPRTAGSAAALLDLGICAVVNMPIQEHGRTVAVFIVHDVQPHDWSPEVLTFLRNVADRVEVGIARLKAEAEQQILNHELSHRLKNTFAMIQAIAVQSLRRVPDQAPVETFHKRLLALSAAHDVLLQKRWSEAGLDEIAAAVIETVSAQENFDVTGAPIKLGPRAALSTSLLLHELTTNAMKYGALSQEGGRVALGWVVAGAGGEGELVLTWRETGGPPVAEPGRSGFGSRLIRMGLVGAGGVTLRYAMAGLEAEFRAPLGVVQGA